MRLFRFVVFLPATLWPHCFPSDKHCICFIFLSLVTKMGLNITQFISPRPFVVFCWLLAAVTLSHRPSLKPPALCLSASITSKIIQSNTLLLWPITAYHFSWLTWCTWVIKKELWVSRTNFAVPPDSTINGHRSTCQMVTGSLKWNNTLFLLASSCLQLCVEVHNYIIEHVLQVVKLGQKKRQTIRTPLSFSRDIIRCPICSDGCVSLWYTIQVILISHSVILE